MYESINMSDDEKQCLLFSKQRYRHINIGASFICSHPLMVPGGSQWRDRLVFPGRVSVEGAPVCPGERAPGGVAHQVCPLLRPEWTVEGPVCSCRTQHLSEQVRLISIFFIILSQTF